MASHNPKRQGGIKVPALQARHFSLTPFEAASL